MNLQDYLNIYSKDRKGAFFYGASNNNNNNPVFRQSGNAFPDHQPFNEKTLFSWGSASKILTGIVCTLMMEQGLITSSDPLSNILPDIFQGKGTYFKSITVTNPDLFPRPESYTSELGTFEWNKVTVGDLLTFSIGLPDDVFFLTGLAVPYYTNPVAIQQVLAENSVVGLGNVIQFYIMYSQMLKGEPIGPVTKIYNGATTILEIFSTAIPELIRLNVDGILPALFPPNSVLENALPYRTRIPNVLYDLSYFILGYILDRIAINNKYRNFSEYVKINIFDPCEMKNSYILLQDKIPSPIAEYSWRRSPSLGLTTRANPSIIQTWLGYQCSDAYRNIAGSKGPGPLVWGSSFPEDGISRVMSNVFYYRNGVPDSSCLGNSPLVSSIEDFGKLLSMITHKGIYQCKQVMKPQSFSYLTSTKIQSLNSSIAYAPYPLSNTSFSNRSFCMGFNRTNRDQSNDPVYGFDSSVIQFFGITGASYYINLEANIWFVYGVAEPFLSSGNLPIPGIGESPYSEPISSRFLVLLEKENKEGSHPHHDNTKSVYYF